MLYMEHFKEEGKPLFTELDEKLQHVVKAWILDNLSYREAPNYARPSDWLLKKLKETTNLDLTERQLKMAMVECGYHPSSAKKEHWVFRISTLRFDPYWYFRHDSVQVALADLGIAPPAKKRGWA